MATTPQQGIMALPETDEASAPQLSLQESYDAAKQGLTAADPKFTAMYDDEMSKVMPALMALSDAELDTMLQLVQYLQDHPEEYTQRIQELESDGSLEKGALPTEYDENFLAVLGAAILEAQQTNSDTGAAAPAMQPPMQLAKGGIAEAARMVASHGRSGDTMLAHITKDEAALLKKHGGMGTLNPRTGLREYGLWGSIKSAAKSVAGGLGITKAFSVVSKAVKGVLNSTVGRIIATVALAAFLGPGAFGIAGMGLGSTAAMGLASAGITALGGGNLKDVVKAGVTGAIAGYGSEVLGPAMGGATGVTNAAGQAAMGAGAAGAGAGLLQGKSLKDSVKDGMTAAALAGITTGATQGFGAKVDPATGKVVSGGAEVVDSAAPKTPDQIQAEMAKQGNLSVANQPTQAPAPVGAGADVPVVDSVAARTPAQILEGSQSVAPPVASGQPGAPSLASSDAAFNRALANSGAGTSPSWTDSVSEWYDKNLSPSGRAAAGADKAMQTVMDKYGVTQQQVLNAPENSILGKQLSAATPGVLSNYGPMVAAGLGATALMGGFKSQDNPKMSPEMASAMSGQATRDLMAANPKDYLVQNLPGVQYDEKGNIIGSTPWTPRKAAQTEVGSSSYIPFTLPTYNAPMNSVGGRQIQQPYNMPDMYSNLMTPRYAADGGFMQAQPTFPGTPLTMDSGPLMAQQAHPLAMNTPGVPMNTPMGFADGGIASLSPQHYSWGGDVFNAIKDAIAKMQLDKGTGTTPAAANAPAAPAPRTAGMAQLASNAPSAPVALADTATDAEKAKYADALFSYQAQKRSYDAQKAANDQLAAYHARQLAAQQGMVQDPVLASGQQVGSMLNPSLSNADFAARLAAGARRPVGTMAVGGIASLAPGGYPRRTGQISGPGTETSDDIPAMLSDGEFVMTAKAVKGLGGGSRRAGAKKMYALMHRLEKNAARG